MRSISIIATQLLGVFERESFVCRAGSLALHLLVLPSWCFVLVYSVHLPRGKNISKPQDPTASLQQIPPHDLMADLKRSRDSSSHGPNKLPRLSSFHPDEYLDNPVHTLFERYMGMMRDRQER